MTNAGPQIFLSALKSFEPFLPQQKNCTDYEQYRKKLISTVPHFNETVINDCVDRVVCL